MKLQTELSSFSFGKAFLSISPLEGQLWNVEELELTTLGRNVLGVEMKEGERIGVRT